MPFVSLGFALTQEEVGLVPGTVLPVRTNDEFLFGVSAGGGLDFAVTDNFILRTEYLYDNYAEKQMNTIAGGGLFPTQKSNLSSHTLRFGLSYHF